MVYNQMMANDSKKKSFGFTRNHTIAIAIAWAALIVFSLVWNLVKIHNSAMEKARIEARTIFELNLVYRRWASIHGGVYVPVTDKLKPNPYLKAPKRDIKTIDGIDMTLVNPAWMTRQVFEMLAVQSPDAPKNRITSLKYLNPINKPDEWETKALAAFEKGIKEFSEISSIDGKPYMRLMKPMYTDEGCLKCHGHQGYKKGELRGGIGIAVPLWPFYAEEKTTSAIVLLTHLLIGAAGLFIILVFSRNIRKNQEEIAKSEWKFRTLSEFSTDWEYWIAENENLLYVSPSCERITGYTSAEFMQNPKLISSIVYDEDKHKYEEHMHDFNILEHEELQFRIVAKAGDIKWISHVCGPIYDNGFIGRRVSNRDISDRKRLEEKLLQAQKMESLGLLAGGVAHDFNNLLTAIIGYSSLINNEGVNEKVRDYVRHVLNASDKARNLTAGLLAFSRKQIIEPKPVSLNNILGDLSKLLQRLIPEDIAMTIEYSASEFPVFADRHQLEQVIINLVTNARDAMPNGGKINMSVSVLNISQEYANVYEVKPGKYMMFSISDTGLGIEKKNLPHIFEPFFTTKEAGKGTGLGLSMAYGIIKQHNGFINVYSEKEVGTTFKIYLPAMESSIPSQTTEEKGMTGADLRGNETILAADDEASIREFIREMLEKYGYKVITAEDGEDAVQKFKEHNESIDMALLDVIMPKKNGKEVFIELKHLNPELKILFMSGYADDILSTKGIYEEGLDFIAKPIDPTLLLTKIRAVLDSKA
jgi:PAS domain S-box-containing protein